MYKKILAAVNEHINSEISARYALNLAKACGAKFYLCFIAEKGMPKFSLDKAEDAVKRLFIKAEEMGIQVGSVTETGDPVREIKKIVRHEKISIVFASTRRQDVERRFYTGTIARSLSLSLPCSVALIRVVHMGRIHPKNILVPLRGHITNLEEKACFVAKLAEGFESTVTLFHSPSPITSFFHGEIHLKPAQREEHIPKDIEQLTECLHRYNITFEKRTGYGRISRAITIEAAHRRNDLIVMGASERSLLRSIISGNPVEDVLRETPCNLIILRPGH